MGEKVPKQVEEADRLAREWVAGLNGEAEAADDETAEEEEKTSEEDEPDESKESDKPDDKETDTGEEEGKAEEEETDSKDEEEDEEETWQQRYQTLKGMFDAEVPRLNRELSEMKATVFERLGRLAEQGDKSKDTPAADEEAEVPEEVQAFIEEMGPEYIAKLDKYMQYMMQPLVESSVRPVADKVDDVEDATFKTAQKQFTEYLDTQVNGDWKELMQGEDTEFIAFLNSPDPSGLYTNGQLMKLYNDNWDADRLAVLLNSYLGEPEAEEEEPEPKPKPKEKKKVPNVQPKRKSPNTTPPDEEERKIWTQADIKDLEKAERDGKLTEEESKAQFADLLAAANEGRIRG